MTSIRSMDGPPTVGIPGRVTFLDGRGDLPMIELTTAWSTAEIYLHGAHVTHFQQHDQPPLLFLSQCSRFEDGKAIRGGVPVILPWFGSREGLGQHGFVRNNPWLLKEVAPESDGSVSARFRFPECPESATYPPFLAEFVVTVREYLAMELLVTNPSESAPFEFEECLHTYFLVESIDDISVHGLKGVSYLDKTANQAQKIEAEEAIRFASEVDRTYIDTTSIVEIRDPRLARTIRVEKENSASTVVWNPWSAKAQQMADFGSEEYRKMVCVESGNVGPNKIVLPPGKTASLRVKISSLPLVG